MTEAEVKKLIGKKNWKKFIKWMGGQTARINKDGSINYYTQDVYAFALKLETGYDRQKSGTWD